MAGWGCTCAPDPLFSYHDHNEGGDMDTEYIDYDALDASDFEDYDPYYDDPHYDQDEESFA
ncbi:hypothetical protein SEA_HORTUS1_13 [Microbacterium phage Hortus1]|nr:hypothetical protein SEA_HORTUS1_13 [Microbacterium phage Hortus1]AWY05587.1 hypothetical protein SEA_OLINDD_13 [Microbacterium phage OlinDD]AWY06346.1 hypothetical protein SEA_TANDEM_13 [Microbacterium phage Tandem]QAU07350.2 hypothetical protein SEA_ALLEB_15 [Microbacterium phage Alleb]